MSEGIFRKLLAVIPLYRFDKLCVTIRRITFHSVLQRFFASLRMTVLHHFLYGNVIRRSKHEKSAIRRDDAT